MNLRSYNISLQLEFSKQSLAYSIFLIRRRNEYSAISDLAIHELLDRLLHKIFVWSGILKIDNHLVQNPIIFEKC